MSVPRSQQWLGKRREWCPRPHPAGGFVLTALAQLLAKGSSPWWGHHRSHHRGTKVSQRTLGRCSTTWFTKGGLLRAPFCPGFCSPSLSALLAGGALGVSLLMDTPGTSPNPLILTSRTSPEGLTQALDPHLCLGRKFLVSK